MKRAILLSLALLVAVSQPSPTRSADAKTARSVRIGVDVRLSFQTCVESWTPVADYLSKAIPSHRFVIVPLASHQDMVRVLENHDVDFVILDPAMEIVANDRFGASPLVTMVETLQGQPRPEFLTSVASGTLIRRADRFDMRALANVRGQRLSAVKPWSLTGWIAQWGLLDANGVDPQRDVKQVVFEGTNVQVVRSVLSGSSDVGAVDSQLLRHLIRSKRVDVRKLYYFNRQGVAVPLTADADVASTRSYPGRVLSKVENVSDELAQRVANALMKKPVATTIDGVPYEISWTIACNYAKVRRLLQNLMGSQYAYSPGFPPPKHYSSLLYPVAVTGVGLVALLVMFLLSRSRFSRREAVLRGQLEDVRRQLVEVRAERQRINSILSLAGCGIDIVDDENHIVYADSGLERDYGDWHGRKCHEYFCGSDTPCPGCERPGPLDEPRELVVDIDGSEAVPEHDPHLKVHYISGESTRMIGIPFRDEGGRWLYARIHFPLAAFSTSDAG